MTTLTPTRLAAMPRVNLLPPEIAAAARIKRLRTILAIAVAGVAAFVFMLFMVVSGQMGAAEDDLATAEATGQQLTAEKATYAEVPVVYAAVTSAQQNLSTAMTPEIRWSFYLSDLSLTIPRNTRIASMTAINEAAAAQLAGGLAIAAPVEGTSTEEGGTTETPPAAPVSASMGSMTFSGKSTDFDAVAAWLQSLSRQEGYADPFVQNITKADSESTAGGWFDVESSTKLDLAAASNRYQQIGIGDAQ